MAIDKYSGLSQSDKFYARYGKAIGKEAVKRQQTHVALEAVKKEAAAKLQLPNYLANAPKQQLRLPNLAGGVYDEAIKAATKPKVSEKFIDKMLKKIASDPTFNWRGADLTPEQIAAIEKRLGKSAAQAGENLPAVVQTATNTGAVATTGAAASSTTAATGGTSAAGNGASKILGLPNGVKKAAQTAANNPAGLPSPAKSDTAKGLKGILEKLKSFAATKKGKIGLVAAAAAAVVAGGVYLFTRNKEIPAPTSTSSPENDLANAPVNGKMSANGPYTVAKGDNVWNIARAHLMELHKDEKDYNPTDVQIMQHTEELMQLNNLHYEKDCYRVIIQPNQSLKLVA